MVERQADQGRDLRRELDDVEDDHPESWIPKVGDRLVGVLERYETAGTVHGPALIAIVRDENSNELRSVWVFHTVLRSEFKKQRPQPGERIGIKRRRDSNKGYRRYALIVDRTDAANVQDIPEFAVFDAGPTATDKESLV